MKLKFTLMITTFVILFTACSKNEFNERDAINAQKELLNLKYQHELDLETLKQKGANALQELLNTAALEQLKLNDSLANKSAIDARKQDYSIVVVDAFTNAPVSDADVTVSSQGKLYTAKTSAQGTATFSSLYLFPTSAFLISKAGYAATQVLQQHLYNGAAKLWNTADLSNEITGTLYIDTDLTNAEPEKVGENVLVTASATVATSGLGSYTIYFPSYTTASGTYSIKVPAVANGYTLSFQQIVADQKLFVNSTEDDGSAKFPAALPRATTIKTYFNVNSYGATVPSLNNYYYFKVAPDKTGRVLYIAGNDTNYGYNMILVSPVGDKFQVERLNIDNYYNNMNINTYTYNSNEKIDVELVDATGKIIQSAPKLMATTNSAGKITSYYSIERGSGIFHLKRDDNNALVPNAKGILLKASVYDQYNNLFSLNNIAVGNVTYNRYVQSNFLLPNKGDKKTLNFYYGSGDSRVKTVY